MRAHHPSVAAADRFDQLRRTDPTLRRRLLEIRTWALAAGVPVDADAMTAVLGTVAHEAQLGADPHLWTRGRVFEFVWGRCVHWCLTHGVAVPRGTPIALEQYWAHLHATAGFTPGSEEPAVLIRALHACGGRPPRPRRKQRSSVTPAQGPALRA